MAYAGVCFPNNIQDNAIAQFHVVSIDQIRSVTRIGSGNVCGVRETVTNENPSLDAGVDLIIPARTPFKLVAEGTDTDADDLTYTWDQTDTGTISDKNEDTGDNAIFRSSTLSSENVRYIPNLDSLFSGKPIDGEYLPVTDRDIEMVSTVRDGNGGLQTDLINIQVVDTGESFRISSHTYDQTFGLQDITEIQWVVADTNVSPVSCANVDIGVISDVGVITTFVTTENDGYQQITIPDNAPTIEDARLIVSCSDNSFFNLSSGHIKILDQVGGGTIGEFRDVDPNSFVANDASDTVNTDDSSDTDDSDDSENSDSDDSNGSDGKGGGSIDLLNLWLTIFMLFASRRKLSRYK